MILSDKDLETRLASDENISNIIVSDKLNAIAVSGGLEVRTVNPNIGKRGNEIPDVVRQMIAATAIHSDESQSETAKVFGVTAPFVSQVTRGLVDSKFDSNLAQVANGTKAQKSETAHNLALDSLVSSLGLVNKNLDQVISVKEAAKLAVDMSKVVSTLRKNDDDESKPKTLIIIKNVPNQKQESQFDVIDV